MKKLLSAMIITSVISSSVLFGQAAVKTPLINGENSSRGVIAINYSSSSSKNTKLMVEKEGTRYIYNINSSGLEERIPLQLGSGNYDISILENIQGNSYKLITKDSMKVALEDEKSVYLNSIQNINWNETMKVVEKAKELTKDAETEEEKMEKIYNYIINNVKYDFDKMRTVTPGYVPSAEDTFISGKGICYDYASLFAAMLRSVGIPAKLIKGYTNYLTEYHAWNQVYLEGKGWVSIDTTYDAGMLQGKQKVSMYKDAGTSKVAYEY
jgi:transglutaminase-like putative cysteine protease